MEHREIGSEFHWMDYPKGGYLPWPASCRWYATGRDAFASLWAALGRRAPCKVFVPDYFCPEVVSFWIARGIAVRPYTDNPLLLHPDWDSIGCAAGDMVLAVNFFGIRPGEPWTEWKKSHGSVVLVEDHTHDPLSGWARASCADYAFASVRKVLPVADGAVLWSPRSMALPRERAARESIGSVFKLAAMFLKRDFLEHDSRDRGLKDAYRGLQEKGEELLAGPAISPESRFLVSRGYPAQWRAARARNVRTFLRLLRTRGAAVKPLFTSWPSSHCPFNAVVLAADHKTREGLRRELIGKNIYPAVHWRANEFSTRRSREIASRILTIPVDHRYGPADCERVVRAISDKLS